jgi:hypothetical protein
VEQINTTVQVINNTQFGQVEIGFSIDILKTSLSADKKIQRGCIIVNINKINIQIVLIRRIIG